MGHLISTSSIPSRLTASWAAAAAIMGSWAMVSGSSSAVDPAQVETTRRGHPRPTGPSLPLILFAGDDEGGREDDLLGLGLLDEAQRTRVGRVDTSGSTSTFSTVGRAAATRRRAPSRKSVQDSTSESSWHGVESVGRSISLAATRITAPDRERRLGLRFELADPLADDDLGHVGNDLPGDLFETIRRQFDHPSGDPVDVFFGQLEGGVALGALRRRGVLGRAVPRARCRPWTIRP